MPLFFFHARHGETLTRDLEGTEWPDLDTARAEAIAAARELAADDLRANRPVRNFQIEIANGAGQQLAAVSAKDAVEPNRWVQR
jgi:hypothetical protein